MGARYRRTRGQESGLCYVAGDDVKVVCERLGHASASLTLDVYYHVLPDMQQWTTERLENLLFQAATA